MGAELLGGLSSATSTENLIHSKLAWDKNFLCSRPSVGSFRSRNGLVSHKADPCASAEACNGALEHFHIFSARHKSREIHQASCNVSTLQFVNYVEPINEDETKLTRCCRSEDLKQTNNTESKYFFKKLFSRLRWVCHDEHVSEYWIETREYRVDVERLQREEKQFWPGERIVNQPLIRNFSVIDLFVTTTGIPLRYSLRHKSLLKVLFLLQSNRYKNRRLNKFPGNQSGHISTDRTKWCRWETRTMDNCRFAFNGKES